MNTLCLQCFVSESQHHQGKLAYEWLLDLAREQGLYARLPARTGVTG